MTFYQPPIAWVQSWAIAASPGDARLRSVSIPPIATTQASIFTAWTSVVASGSTATGGGDGWYYSSSGTQLSQALGAASGMSTATLLGTHRYAACNLIGDAETVAANTPLDSYLAGGVHYDFVLGAAASVGDPTISLAISGLLTIVVLNGSGVDVPATAKAATGGLSNYGPVTGSSGFFTNIWLDPFNALQIHMVSCWGATPVLDTGSNWWPAGEVTLGGLYQAVKVAANSPVSASKLNSPATYELYPLGSTSGWAVMTYQSNVVPSEVVPPIAVTAPRGFVTILG